MSTVLQVSGVRTAPVAGGSLTFEIMPGTTEPVLFVHGLSSQRRLWNWVRAAAAELTLIAPDLRGRADSVHVSGPSSIRQHVTDLVAVLDELGLAAVHVCGMSMGAFVAVELAATHPERVKSLVLVDGGIRFAPVPGLTPDLVPGQFADRLGRLNRPWDTVDDYADFFVSTTAPMLDRADPLLRNYLEHDLRDGAVQLSADAVVADATDVFFGANHWHDVVHPVRFLHAEWSAGAGSAPAYTSDDLSGVREKAVSATFLAGCDHAGTVMTAAGAAVVATVIQDALR